MRHARADYGCIQDVTGDTSIAPDEPVFIIRAQDVCSGDAVRAWADIAEATGAPQNIVNMARSWAIEMDNWPEKKVPDL